jgi:hypothetical protein
MPDPTSWLRVINKFEVDAQSALARFIDAPVETSKARVCQWKSSVRGMRRKTAKQRPKEQQLMD